MAKSVRKKSMAATLGWRSAWISKRISSLIRADVLAIRCYSPRLVEVGKMETPKQEGKYATGQMFLHQVFGYRGMVLFPWMGTLHEKDIEGASADSHTEKSGKELTYYSVLVDERDLARTRAGSENVTFLRHGQIQAIPGMDYISHEDALPYKSSEKIPIQNDYFQQFLVPDRNKAGQYTASDRLREFQNKNYRWLEVTTAYRLTTNNIRITVMPFYLGPREIQQTEQYCWRYIIRVENLGEDTVTLTARVLKILCPALSGTVVNEKQNRGVNGVEPVLSKQRPAYQFISHVALEHPSGTIWGRLTLTREDGSSFEGRIPPFSLESREFDTSPYRQ